MRSSVSVILSRPPPDTSMSYPDYSAHPHHHQTLLVLVRQVGSHLKSRSFHKLYERISRVNHVKVNDSSGNERRVWITYRREYPPENNDWGDFQAHRRALGIVTIGQVTSQSDLNEVCKQHESLKVKYSSTLYDSRCIILGINPDGSVYESPKCSTKESPIPELIQNGISSVKPGSRSTESSAAVPASGDRDSGVYETVVNSEGRLANGETSSQGGTSNSRSSSSTNGGRVLRASSDSGSECTSEGSSDTSWPAKGTSGSSGLSLQPPNCFKTRALFYPSSDHAVNIETQMQEFLSSLFWVLEYKRVDKSQEKLDRPYLLCAPFERKDMVGLDLDSRTNKKRCSGRLKKHLADVCLQVGLSNDALAQYAQAIDILKGCNDWLWLAACYEGLCSASVMILYPNLFQNNVLQRYSSLGIGGIGVSCCNIQSDTPGRSRKSSVNSNSLPVGLDPLVTKQTAKYCLSAEDIVEKYKEAIVHYSKYRNAGVIETETSIKAVHVLIEQRKYLLAAEFLSNVVFINLQLSDEEKIIRFNSLSDLYHQIGFHRKAAFFRRVAAMRCVAPQNQEPDWNKCYRLLLLTLSGYKLSLDLNQFVSEGRPGWPALQIQILQELVGTSRRMGENGLCTRHQAFLMSAMLPHFSPSELQDTFSMLEAVSAKCPSGPQPLMVTDSATIVPPVNFINIPVCRFVQVIAPSKEKRVEHRDGEVVQEGPFIFSPFQSSSANKKVTDFDWVEGDVCEVRLSFWNPLPFQLKFSSIMLMTEGVEFEPWTSTVVIEAGDSIQDVSLRGRPQKVGELRIVGYSSCLAGVSSNCKFKVMDQLKVPFYSLNIVPALPCVQIFCDSSSSDTGLVSDGGLDENNKVYLVLNAGQTQECNIIIHNVSSQLVESIEVALESTLDTQSAHDVFQYSFDNLKAQLPISPGGRASLTLYVYATSHFRLSECQAEEDDMTSLMSGAEPLSLLSGGPSSLLSRQSNVMSSLKGSKAHRAQSSASMMSSRSGSSVKSGSSSSAVASSSTLAFTPMALQGLSHHTLEGTIKLSYSGGRGLEKKYWRVAEVGVIVEVIPSLLVTHWDALPAEFPHQCYIVLDLLNASNNEMDLSYTPSKHILIQAGESCRVPIPMDRCPLSKLEEKPAKSEGDQLMTITEVLSEHIASLLELRWTLGPSSAQGRASLSELSFPAHTHYLITMAPITWHVKLNGQEHCPENENTARTGEPLQLSIGVCNSSDAELSLLAVLITPFQDNQNGVCSYRLEAKMAATGATRYIIPKLGPEEKHDHDCRLIFFTAGTFKVEMSCSPSDGNDTYPRKESCSPTSPSAWKLAPPIEITVVDA